MEKTDSQTSEAICRKVISNVAVDGEGLVTAELRCARDFPAFAGHFPEQPVLPAVMQLAVVRSLTSDALGYSLEPVATGKLKFKEMVGPDDLVMVRVEIANDGDRWESSFRLERDGNTVSTGIIIFRKRD